tara:strand:+ start:121 stop:288 length:168 start_codon:yes stop_codon:yes gene_type:complete
MSKKEKNEEKSLTKRNLETLPMLKEEISMLKWQVLVVARKKSYRQQTLILIHNIY